MTMFILEVLSHTPIWVWALLAFLISRGVVAMRPRVVSPARVLIVPVVFFIWGLTSLIGAGDAVALKLGLFVVGLLAGLAAGWALAAAMPAPRLARETGMLAMPGSPIPLTLIVVAFASKYVGAVALAIVADPALRAEIAALLAAVGGLFAGLFWGRTLGQFAAALRADGEPATLASLVAMASARGSAKTAS
jgi:hypothetical protein